MTGSVLSYFDLIFLTEPKDRIGARDKTYYSSIRDHPFFKGLDIDKLHQSAPACLETFVKDADVPGTTL